MDQETKAQFERLNKKLNDLLAGQRKETWVSPGFVSDLTGWDFRKLAQAREQKIIEYKESGRGNKKSSYLYKLESIPEQFIIRRQAS